MEARKMEYDELFGSISYESKDQGSCRLLDYADDWKLADDEEKAQIRLAAKAPELLEACKMALRFRLMTHYGDDALLAALRIAIQKATAQYDKVIEK